MQDSSVTYIAKGENEKRVDGKYSKHAFPVVTANSTGGLVQVADDVEKSFSY